MGASIERVFYTIILIIALHVCVITSLTSLDRSNLASNADNEITKRLEYVCGTTSKLPTFANVRELSVELKHCKALPVRMFVNSTAKLRKLVITSRSEINTQNMNFTMDVLHGLDRLEELELHGFADISNVEPKAFQHLRNIHRLYLNSFGVEHLALSEYTDIIDFLRDLSGTPLTSLSFNDFRRISSYDKNLNFDTFLNISNVTLLHLAIDNSVIKSVSGRLSRIMPSLTSVRLSLATGNDHPVTFIVDAFFIHKNLRDVHIYGFGEKIPILRFDYDEKKTKGYEEDIRNIVVKTKFEDTDCSLRFKLVLSVNVTSATLNSILLSEFPSSRNLVQICFDQANSLESLDMSDSAFPSYLPIFSGLVNLRTLNFRRTGLREFSLRHLEFLPRLQHYLLGGNDFDYWIKTDYNSNLFHAGHNLATLDLSNCQLTEIPFLEFIALRMLQTLDLSGNRLTVANFSIINSTQLSSINISHNAIEQLHENFTSQVNTLMTGISRSNNSLLKIDLRGNPLSCLCNATNFVRWIQITKTITLPKYENNSNTCLYPNGSWLNIMDVKIPQLKDNCKTINMIVNNTECSCDEAELTKFYAIRYSLVDYYCLYPDSTKVRMNYIDSEKLLGLCKTVKQSALFVGLLSSGLATLIIVVLFVMFLWIYKKKRPADYQQMLACLNLNRLTNTLMGMISYHNMTAREPESESEYAYDAFVAYDNRNGLTRSSIREILSKFHLMGITVVTEDDYVIGSSKLNALLESIAQCRMIILMLTPGFISDDWCREMAIRAIARQNAVVPIVLERLNLNETHLLFTNIFANCAPIFWSNNLREEETLLKEVKERLNKIV